MYGVWPCSIFQTEAKGGDHFGEGLLRDIRHIIVKRIWLWGRNITQMSFITSASEAQPVNMEDCNQNDLAQVWKEPCHNLLLLVGPALIIFVQKTFSVSADQTRGTSDDKRQWTKVTWLAGYSVTILSTQLLSKLFKLTWSCWHDLTVSMKTGAV